MRQSYRWTGNGVRVRKGALLHAPRHIMATRLAKDGPTPAKSSTYSATRA